MGTGISDGIIDSNKSKNSGLFGWARPSIDLTMNSLIKALEYQMEIWYDLLENNNNYLRVNASLSKGWSQLSNASPENIKYLKRQAKAQIINNNTMRLKIDVF